MAAIFAHFTIARFARETAWHELIVGGERWQMPCLMPNRKASRIVVTSKRNKIEHRRLSFITGN